MFVTYWYDNTENSPPRDESELRALDIPIIEEILRDRGRFALMYCRAAFDIGNDDWAEFVRSPVRSPS